MVGKDGLLKCAGEGTLTLDMSASSPSPARELESIADERGVGVLGAPVSGEDTGVEEGTLPISRLQRS